MKTRLNGNERLVRLLIVDAIAHSRESLATYLQLQDSLEVIGETAVASEAFYLSQRFQPDIVIMDVNLPDGDSFSTTRQLLQLDNAPDVILLAVHPHRQILQQAQAAGAVACIDKSAGVDAILEAIHTVSRSKMKENQT